MSYGKKPVRAVLAQDGLWFAATDLYAVNRLRTDRSILARIAPDHLRLLSFPSETGQARLTAVSPLGALTVAKYLPYKIARTLDAWVRRETGSLAAAHGLSPLGMEMLADGTMPIKPRVAHDLYLPWMELNLLVCRPPRRTANHDEPALADEDANALPARRAEGAASIARLLAAGEAALARDKPPKA